MGAAKLAISIDESLMKRLDRLIKKGFFPNRSKAFQVALQEKIDRMGQVRLAKECAKLDRKSEQKMLDIHSPWSWSKKITQTFVG